jgi:hypothetical protein
MPGNSSWMPCAPEAVTGLDDDDNFLSFTPLLGRE